MRGGAGADQLGGDAGDDVMSGGAGDDKYVYRPGSGSDTIINEGGGTDWLLFTDDLTADRLGYFRKGDDLRVKIDGSEESMVTIKDWFADNGKQVDYIQPSGGYGIPASEISGMAETEAVPATAAASGGIIAAAASGQCCSPGNEDHDYQLYGQGTPAFSEGGDTGIAAHLPGRTAPDEETGNQLLAGLT